MSLQIKLFKLLYNEWLTRQTPERIPEPQAVMSDRAHVEAFNHQGQQSLLPIYLFNALCLHERLPAHGTLFDLGCGSGQFLSFFSQCRPDVQIKGIDLSQTMIDCGQDQLKSNNKIHLQLGDMTNFFSLLPQKVDVISSIFSLHHLPSYAHLRLCLEQMAQTRKQKSSTIWIFDHSRPCHSDTAELFPKIFTPLAEEDFKMDSTNSLRAAWSFKELSSSIDQLFDQPILHKQSRFLKLYQFHSIGSKVLNREEWVEPQLSSEAQKDFKKFSFLFSSR